MFRLSSSLFVFATLWGSATAMMMGPKDPSCSGPTGGACDCMDQSLCADYTIEAVTGGACDTSPTDPTECSFKVCFCLNFDAECELSVGDAISHSCVKDDELCYDHPDFLGYFSGATEVQDVGDGYCQCQFVPPGGQAQFLLKDGQVGGECGSYADTVEGTTVQCMQAESAPNFIEKTDSCTGNIDTECIWFFNVPDECGDTTGIGGDPHLTRWSQKYKESFHGECDLVFLQSEDFNKGEGLDIHVRTTQRGHYSYVEQVGMRIGDDILSFDNDGNIVFNSMELTMDDLPFTFGGGQYKINYPYPGRKSQRNKGLDMKTYNGAIVYHIDLHDKSSYIDIKAAGLYMGVEVYGFPTDFGNGKGLSGEHGTGARIGRDGQEHDDVIAFGMDWQVQEHEAVLFPAVREPQHPRAQCNMPTTDSRRVLKKASPELKAEAEAECMERFPEELDLCIVDVVATGSTMILDSW